ncbi:MAG: type VI secretion system baseplate subunit TssF, partial [Proteobacteria bacterium]|nr:type VI secretion system baseplate subunit TssF [Pseudomonadota bacterium]
KTDSNIEFSELDLPGLEFYISGEVNSALQLYWMLSAEVKQVMLTPDKEKTIYLGSQEVIQPSHLSSQNSICPNSPRSFSGFRVLHDYFSFMEKFLFIKIMNLEKLIWPKQCHECVIEITFKKQEGSSLNMNTAQLQINCVPAVNLYSATSEPIAYTGERYQYIVHPDISYEDSVNIYSVDSVTGVDPRTLNQFQYIEFPNISKENQSDGFYQIKKQGLGKNKEVLYLRLTDKNKMPQTLSCKLTVSNGCYPHLYIHENTEMMTASDLPRFLQVRNLTKPSPFLLNPNKKGTTWEFLKHWTINRDSLSNIENLKSLLNSYHWGCQYDHNNRIDGLHKITMSLKNKIKNGVFQQGVNIQLEVDEALYFGFGDIYCFGSVLHQLFIEYVAMNWFLDMQLICIPSGKEFLWKTDSGKLWPI